MRLFALFATVLAASLAHAESPSVAVLDFTVVGGDAALGSVYAERFATRLEQRGLKVLTQKAITSMLTLTRQQQLMGCDDAAAAACMAELADGLGSAYLAAGQVAKVGDAWQVNVRVIANRSGSTFSSFSKTVGSESASLEAVADAADGFLFTLDPTLAKPRVAPFVVGGLGLATAAVGGVFLGRVIEANTRLRGPVDATFTPSAAVALAKERTIEQAVSIGLLVGGGLALGGGLLWLALGGPQAVKVALGPGSVSVSVQW